MLYVCVCSGIRSLFTLQLNFTFGTVWRKSGSFVTKIRRLLRWSLTSTKRVFPLEPNFSKLSSASQNLCPPQFPTASYLCNCEVVVVVGMLLSMREMRTHLKICHTFPLTIPIRFLVPGHMIKIMQMTTPIYHACALSYSLIHCLLYLHTACTLHKRRGREAWNHTQRLTWNALNLSEHHSHKLLMNLHRNCHLIYVCQISLL